MRFEYGFVLGATLEVAIFHFTVCLHGNGNPAISSFAAIARNCIDIAAILVGVDQQDNTITIGWREPQKCAEAVVAVWVPHENAPIWIAARQPG